MAKCCRVSSKQSWTARRVCAAGRAPCRGILPCIEVVYAVERGHRKAAVEGAHAWKRRCTETLDTARMGAIEDESGSAVLLTRPPRAERAALPFDMEDAALPHFAMGLRHQMLATERDDLCASDEKGRVVRHRMAVVPWEQYSYLCRSGSGIECAIVRCEWAGEYIAIVRAILPHEKRRVTRVSRRQQGEEPAV